jgi:hypothetical protein
MTMHFRRLPGVGRHIASTVRRVLGDSGKPLSPGVRADLEPRFQADFSTVRVHADETANASARQLGARAYTVGQHIVFGRGGFAPDTAAGRELLAHELTHTIQQGQVNGVPAGTTSRHDGAEAAARHQGGRALAGAAPSIAPSAPAIARDEGTAEVVDTTHQFQQQGSVFSATMQRDQYRTHAEAQQARQAQQAQQAKTQQVQVPQAMDTGFAKISMDSSTGALTIPVTVAVRAAIPADTAIFKPAKISSHGLSPAKVNEIANQFIAECNDGLNNWFTLYVPPCQGVPFAGRELPITVKVTRTSAGQPDFTVAVSPHTGRSFVSHSAQVVVLYAGDLDRVTMRHEGSHMTLGVPDEYKESDTALRNQAPLQKSDERVYHDWTLAGDSDAWGVFNVLRERHFSFVPAFVKQVLASLGHPECVPELHEVKRPQPHLLRLSLDYGGSSYGGGALWAGAGVDTGRFLDRERSWRAFLGVHEQTFIGPANTAFLLGARIGFEHKWRSSRFGPTAEVYGESGAAVELGAGARGPAPFAGAGASLGVSGWDSGREYQVKLTGGEVLRLDHESYSAFQAGLSAAINF